MNNDAIKGQAVAAISAFNSNQTHSTEQISYVSPMNMTVIDESTVLFQTVRERVLISRYLGGVFQVVGRQMLLG